MKTSFPKERVFVCRSLSLQQKYCLRNYEEERKVNATCVSLHNVIGIRYGTDEISTRSQIVGSITDHTLGLRNAFKRVMERELAADDVERLVLVSKQFVYFHLRWKNGKLTLEFVLEFIRGFVLFHSSFARALSHLRAVGCNEFGAK